MADTVARPVTGRPKVNAEIERLVRLYWPADGPDQPGETLARADLISALQAHSDDTVEAILRERGADQTRSNRSRLVRAAVRVLEVLNLFIEQHDDPGAEALGARYELEVALQPFGRPADTARVAETSFARAAFAAGERYAASHERSTRLAPSFDEWIGSTGGTS